MGDHRCADPESVIRFHPNADQLALAQTIEDSLVDLLPLARLHHGDDEDEATWSALRDMGIFAIGLPEEQGGSNLGAAEEALIAMALGRHLATPAVLATLGAAAPRRIAAAFDDGTRRIVINSRHAQVALVRDSAGAVLQEYAPPTSAPLERYLWTCELQDAVVWGKPLLRFTPAQVLRLRLIDAAALAGLAETALAMGVAYAASREQFGRPIGSFQAIKHHCANMAMAARCARDQTTFAAIALDDARSDAAFQIDSALYVAGSAAVDNAGKNIQIHGGFGFSDEADAHLLIKRAQLQLAVAGGLEAALSRIADARTDW